jgi:hypothetical protein
MAEAGDRCSDPIAPVRAGGVTLAPHQHRGNERAMKPAPKPAVDTGSRPQSTHACGRCRLSRFRPGGRGIGVRRPHGVAQHRHAATSSAGRTAVNPLASLGVGPLGP